MDDKEEGEISDNDDSFGVAYKPVSRPEAGRYRASARHLPSSDEDYSSDSDSDAPSAPKRRAPNITQMDTSTADRHAPKEWNMGAGPVDGRPVVKARRRNNVWSTVMEEQVLAQEIGGFGLKRRLDQGDRSVETYDYNQARRARAAEAGELSDGEDDEEEEEEEESEELKKKRLERKRPVKERLNYRQRKADSPRHLPDITADDTMTDEALGLALAEALYERKPELIVRVVTVLGRSKALELYKDTQQLELDGGLMIMDGSRRRTSGGVFLQLLKDLPGVGKAELMKIFPQEESTQQWRKRKRAHRKRERHESKPQGEDVTEEGLHLGGLFSDDPGGAKCPGSTPVTSPQPSDNESEDLPKPNINQLSPSSLIAAPPSSPPVKDPRSHHPGEFTFNGGFVNMQLQQPAPQGRKLDTYDDDFLDIHGNTDEMDLF